MGKIILLFLMTGFAASLIAETEDTVVKVTVKQLEAALAAAQGKPDAELARQLAGLELSERLNDVKLAQWKAAMPGEKSREQLVILSDLAAFLNPPSEELPADPIPNAAAARQMLTQIVNYVNTTARQLPNFVAVRETVGFEDKPREDIQSPTGLVTEAAMPLHAVGKSTVTVTYIDHRESTDEKSAKHNAHIGGLITSGEFGPVLILVTADALKGKITWGRWEQGKAGKEAVFHFSVPNEKSHYQVLFCCVFDGFNPDGSSISRLFKETAGYQGEITFDPDSGAILRIRMEAEVLSGELVSEAALQVEYEPVEIAGRNYICPVKSVSILKAHTAPQTGLISNSNYKGVVKTFLNDVAFGQYRRFGSETRITINDNPETKMQGGPSSPDAPYSDPKAATH